MLPEPSGSRFHVEKARIDAFVTLSSGDTAPGHFFVAPASAHYSGPGRVGELLNDDQGFFPFETLDVGRTRTVLYNRRHVIMVALAEDEARRVPGYDVAKEWHVSILLSNGSRVVGFVRVYRPEGHDRLSDWARNKDSFHYIETSKATLLVNVAHVIEVSEVPRP